MVEMYEQHHVGVIAVQPVPREDTDKYGIVATEVINDHLSRITSIVEKPKPDVAPSTLAVVGRYILPGEIMGILATTQRGAGNEIQLTDGIATLLKTQQVLAYQFKGTRYDCGSKLGYLQATVDLAMKHPEVAAEFGAWLAKRKS